jgi:2-deoxy-D-gluconate 3-dehydrogenase
VIAVSTPNFSLEGKVAVVTGANTGLGQAMAVAIAAAGANVALVGRSAPDETQAKINELGRETAVVMADLSDFNNTAGVIADSESALGPVDILVNNAGIIRRQDALEFDVKDWDDVMDTNLKVPFFLAQAAAKSMVKGGRSGKIINIASLLSFQGGIRVPSYTASKSGLAGLTRLLACEWAAKGINVNAIVPGYFATNNTVALREDPERNRQILERIPSGRWGDPDDIAGAAVYLASSASDYVQGITLPVDGGWLAR